jgi:peptidoglycan/xylan/chitin deacetylase (PgdA/CDA1 family)
VNLVHCRGAALLVLFLSAVACSGGGAKRAATSATTHATIAQPAAAAPVAPPAPSLPPTGTSAPITSGPRDRHAVALTFDSNLTDSMIRELDSGKVASFDNTAVIDELDQLRVRATIFLAGKWMERYPDTTRRLAADPLFELGSHSYAHLGFTRNCYQLGFIPTERMADDVRHSEQVLHSFAPTATKLFRFPGGCYDDAALRAIAPTGVTVVQYDLPSGDAFGTNVNAIVRQVLDGVHNGSIVVMHITGGNTAPLTAQALPAVVRGLRDRGFALETVTDLLSPRG